MSLRTQMFKILIRNKVIRDWDGKNRINEIKRIEDYEICDVYNNLINSENDLFVVYKECCFFNKEMSK